MSGATPDLLAQMREHKADLQGLLRDLEFCATSDTDNNALFERAVAGLTAPR